MKETKPYWYHNPAYLMEPYFVCLHFPNLLKQLPTGNNSVAERVRSPIMYVGGPGFEYRAGSRPECQDVVLSFKKPQGKALH